MFFTVYQTTNLVNGKIYIGAHSTLDLYDSYLGSGAKLLEDLKVYGKKNFKKEILYILESLEQMYKKEAEIVTTEFILREDTYNQTEGGRFGTYTGSKKGAESLFKLMYYGDRSWGLWSKKSKSKSIETNRQNKSGYCFNKSLQLKGLQRMQDFDINEKRKITYKRIGHAQGSKNSQFGKIWITNGIINQKLKKEEEIPEGFWKGRILKNG